MKHLLLFLLLFSSILGQAQEYSCPCNEDDCGDVISDYEIKGTETVVCDGRLFELRNNTNADVDLYIWDWGDGNIDTLTTADDPSHAYNIPDTLVCDDDKTTYEICLLIIKECSDGVSCHSTRKPITIRHRPRALFDLGTEICVGDDLGIDNLSCNADTYSWFFGNGDNSSDESPSFSYSTPGSYTIRLVVENECGSDEYSQTVQVVDFPETSIRFESDNTGMNEACVPSRQIINANNNQWVNTFSWELVPPYTSINGDWRFVDPSLVGIDPCPCLHDSTFTNNTVDSLLRQETLDLWFKEAGEYDFILRASNICENLRIEEKLILYEPPTINAPIILQECESTEFCFSDLGIQVLGDYNSVSWSFVNGSLSSSSDLDFGCIEFNSSGLMRLEVDAIDPCMDIAQEIEVIIQENFEANILPFDNPYCQGSSLDTLVADPMGGTWSGQGIVDEENGVFDPSTVSPGTYEITYELSNGPCSSSDVAEITVVESEDVIVQDTFACIISQPFELSVNPSGGVFSGNGIIDVNDGLFDPSAASPGDNIVNYFYLDQNDCEINREIKIVVDTIPAINVQDTVFVCLTNDDVDLNGLIAFDANGEQGNLFFNGPGIVDEENGLFNSSGLSPGFYNIQLRFAGRSCEANDSLVIELAEKPTVEVPEDLTLCITDGEINLSPIQGTGGSWSSPNCNIDPTTGVVDLASIGAADCSFIYTIAEGTSCEQSDDMLVTILDLDQQLDVSRSVGVCKSQGTYSFQGSFSPEGGKWSGPGLLDSLNGSVDISQLQADSSYIYTYCIESQEVDCEACKETRLDVYPLPSADFDTDVSPCVNTEFTFINNSENGSEYFWDFGDGNMSTEQAPSYSYTNAGQYIVELITESVQGCRDTVRRTIDIAGEPTLSLDVITDEGCAPLEVVYDNNSFGENVTQFWIIDAVDTLFGEQPSIVLDSVQTDSLMTIELVIFNDCRMFRESKDILVHPYPIVDFGINDDEGCSPDTVWLVNQTVGQPESLLWNFGNGSISMDSMPDFQIYETPDDSISTYAITLYAENSCGADSLTKEITVYPNNVDAFYELDTLSGCPPLIVDIQNYATPGAIVTYDFGDGGSGYSPDTSYTFLEPGTYVITQYASLCGTDVYRGDSIEVFPVEEAQFFAPSTACLGDTVRFVNLSDSTLNVRWEFGDGSFSNRKQPLHVYDSVGTYRVKMILFSQFYNCPDTASIQLIIPEPPSANFQLDTSQYCPFDTVRFENLTSDASIYKWSFGDGNGSIDRSPFHVYSQPGNYQVELVVTDEMGCVSDTAEIPIIVHASPTAEFRFAEETYCQNRDTIYLENSSLNYTINEWYINGTSSNQSTADFRWLPTDTGMQIIELIAVNEFSCRDTFTEALEVLPSPSARLMINDSQGCEPFRFDFSDASEGATGRLWSLDGNTFNDSTEQFTLSDDGEYVLELIAIHVNGCPNDTATQLITVLPRSRADFNTIRMDTCGIPSEVEFENLSADANDYDWNFGNGQSSNAVNPNTRYSIPGNYQIDLIANNEFNCRDTARLTIGVYPSPSAYFELSSLSACAGTAIPLRNISTESNEYIWLVNQDVYEDLDSLTLEEAGEYNITLVASFNGACQDTFSAAESILIYETPEASFDYEVNLDDYVLGDVQFINTSLNASNYFWEFGDGESTTASDPEHVYETNGPFSVCLTAILEHDGSIACEDLVCLPIDIEPINTFYVPNAMSPDRSFGEDLVSVFKPVGIGVESYELNIYSPWGDKIKTLNEVSEGQPVDFWDGRYQGELVPQGAYLWKASVIYKNGNREFKSGNVTVIR